jgi:hypothetical protein
MEGAAMKVTYADPPYLGCGKKFYAKLHPDAGDWDRLETHRSLIERLSAESDAWALSLSSSSLRAILPLCPDDVRIGIWVKPFASYKPGIKRAYAWEPVLFRGGRKRHRCERTVKDWVSANIMLKSGCPGAKPDAFCWWVFEFLGMEPEDEFIDLFPGSGAVTRAWQQWKRAQMPLFVR